MPQAERSLDSEPGFYLSTKTTIYVHWKKPNDPKEDTVHSLRMGCNPCPPAPSLKHAK